MDHNSVTGQRTELTFRALAERVDRIARGLMRLGIERGDVISFQLPNWWQFHALHLAALRDRRGNERADADLPRAGAWFHAWPGREQAAGRAAAFPRLRPSGDGGALRPALPALRHVLVVGGEGDAAFERLLREADGPAGFIRPDPNEVIQVVYTSGTTGEPKGAMHTSNTLFSNVIPYAERLGLTDRDVVLMSSPMAHQTGFMYGMMMSLYLGAKNVLQDIWMPEQAADIIAAEGATFTMASTPFLNDLTEVAQRRPEAFHSFRIFLAGGAPDPARSGAPCRRGAGGVDHLRLGHDGERRAGYWQAGRPAGKDIRHGWLPAARHGNPRRSIRTGAVLPAGEEGRLQARGCSNFVGYLKRPELNGVDADGWFETGDLARMDTEGYVRITGRSKDIIIRGGENIPVVEIEQLLYRHPAVQELAIVAMPDARLGERCCAFVVTEGERSTLTSAK